MLRREQEGLRLEVVLHVAVVVQVVVLEVRKRSHVEDDAVDAVQRQRVRGQLDDAGAALVLFGRRKDARDDGGLGRRTHGLEGDRTDVGLNGAAQRCLREARGNRGAHQVRGCGLAVCAGDRHGRQARGRRCVHVGAQCGDDGARVGHLNDGHAQASFEGLRAALLVRQHDARPGLDRRVCETNAVLLEAGDRDEHPLGLTVVGRHGDAAQAEGGLGNLRK